MLLQWGVESYPGKKGRPNEDRYRVLHAGIPLIAQQNKGQLFAVFDGIGGAPEGGHAAQYVCDALIRFFRAEISVPAAVSLHDLLCEASMAINAWGLMPGTTRPLGGCAGTIAWFFEAGVTMFPAGDTVGYRLRDETLLPLTREHGTGKVLENYFGLGGNFLLDVFTWDLEEGDIFLLVSDGITKGLAAPDIRQCLEISLLATPQRSAAELCRLARLKGSRDDCTALVVTVEEC